MNKIIKFIPRKKRTNKNQQFPKSGKKYLEETLSRIELKEKFEIIENAYSPLRRISETFCSYITLIVPTVEEEGPLLCKCLATAINSWMVTEEKTNSINSSYISYISGLLLHINQLLGIYIYIAVKNNIDPDETDTESKHVWNPLDGPLSNWWLQHQSQPVCRIKRFCSGTEESTNNVYGSQHTIRDLRAKILYQILCSKDLLALCNNAEKIISN